jgi:hypothetical protein
VADHPSAEALKLLRNWTANEAQHAEDTTRNNR